MKVAAALRTEQCEEKKDLAWQSIASCRLSFSSINFNFFPLLSQARLACWPIFFDNVLTSPKWQGIEKIVKAVCNESQFSQQLASAVFPQRQMIHVRRNDIYLRLARGVCFKKSSIPPVACISFAPFSFF